ncbi:MAG: hypothetical protein RL215_1007 [Planctomycetota bacterium]
MTLPDDLLHGYLDQSLTSEQQLELEAWLEESPQHVRSFADLLMLHSQLRSEALLLDSGLPAASALPAVIPELAPVEEPGRRIRGRRRLRRLSGLAITILITLAAVLSFRPGSQRTTVSAASAEILQLITENKAPRDRTYQISVEHAVPVERRRSRVVHSEKRPPKPPMDDATLHVGGSGQFVLIRRRPDGRLFITGSSGIQSWAVRPDSPVRTSTDLLRFSRDLPGHEYSLSLTELPLTLEQLQQSFDVQIVDAGAADESTAANGASIEDPISAATRLLIAVRRPGRPGPRRIEIEYNAASHEIHQIRFIDMPYGPERLTLRLTLTSRDSQPVGFYDHAAHHAPELPVEQE